ncbi:26S proteasome regulatory subunit [Saitoella coloradoensis]
MDIDFDASAFLEQQRDAAPAELQPVFFQLEDLYDRKLWHQLTDALILLFNNPQSAPLRMPLFREFVGSFQGKINQLKLVSLGLSAASQCQDYSKALQFLSDITEKVDTPSTQDAFVYATVETARMKLLLGQLDESRESMDKAGKILDSFDSVENVIHAAYYRVNADYYKAKAEYAAYYKNALLFLACVNVDKDLTIAEAQERAYDLSISALLGETIYNFGELLLHPVLNSLNGTEHEWLREVLFALNCGDIARFEGLQGHLAKQPLLQASLSFLRQKICLTALIEAVFKRPPHDRALAFSTIAAETRLVHDEVEHLVMKALSLNLLKGNIDQVDQVVRVTWVQPRVLDMNQVEGMRQRLVDWASQVKTLEGFVHKTGEDLEVWVQ